VLAFVVLVGARATMGHFPFRVGQIEYAMERMTKNFDETASLHRERLKVLETAESIPSADGDHE
jgi:hypothetical protein